MQDMVETTICSSRYAYIGQLVNLRRMRKNVRKPPCSLVLFFNVLSFLWFEQHFCNDGGHAHGLLGFLDACLSVCALDYNHLEVLAYSGSPCLLHPMQSYVNICCVRWSNGLCTSHRAIGSSSCWIGQAQWLTSAHESVKLWSDQFSV